MKRQSLFVAALWLVAGCSIDSAGPAGGASAANVCNDGSDCATGECLEGACEASAAGLDSLLFEVTPPSLVGGKYAAVRYLSAVDGLRERRDLPLVLSQLAEVAGQVVVTAHESQPGCSFAFVDPDVSAGTLSPGDDGSVPATVELIPHERVLGIPTWSYSGAATKTTSSGGSHYSYRVVAPPGTYDIYVMPYEAVDGSCAVAPQLVKNSALSAGSRSLALPAPSPQLLTVDVQWTRRPEEGADPLAGWRLDMVEPASAAALALPVTLGAPVTVSESQVVYSVPLYFSPVWDAALGKAVGLGQELLRLRPPEGALGPTVLVERAAVELFTPGYGVLDSLTGMPASVTIEGHLTDDEGASLADAEITFVAQSLVGLANGVIAGFSAKAKPDDSGIFRAELLPGTYEVRVAPGRSTCCGLDSTVCSCLAAKSVTWQVGATPSFQAGRELALTPATSLSAWVEDFTGRPLSGIPVLIGPAPTDVGVLDRLLGRGPAVPSSSSVQSASDGHVVTAVDPGTLEVSVRPDEGLRHAWWVKSRVSVSAASSSAIVDLGALTLPLPVTYDGVVRVPSAAADSADALVEVPGALVRAYAMLDATGAPVDAIGLASSAIQVGEARAAADGSFRIRLPAELP